MTAASDQSSEWIGTAGKVFGFLLFVGILAAPTPDGLPPEGQRLAAVTALMAMLWLTQAIPIAATSLVPLAAFPLLGIQSAQDVSQSYMNANVFLFLGGFIIALGIEKWGLHRRMALHIVAFLGAGLKRVVLGFMLATAFLSMWISNTAATLLMLPIGLALLTALQDVVQEETGAPPDGANRSEAAIAQLGVVLMLGIAYASSIGGLTTLVGTPTNVAFQQIWKQQFPEAPELSAGQWMMAFVPVGAVLLMCAWIVLVWRLPAIPGTERFNRNFFTERLRALGRPSRSELCMFGIFAATAALWIFRKPLSIGSEPLVPGWGEWFEGLLLQMGAEAELAAGAVHDSTVAIGMALLMFLIPAEPDENGKSQFLMDWQTAERLPWGILLLVGGGFALAGGFSQTGLSNWVGDWFAGCVADWPVWMLVLAVCLLLTFLTELTSNVATISTLMPILAGTAIQLGIDPRLILFPAAISTSCAFMLPIATPPNAIVFGSGRVRVGHMVRYGLILNLTGAVLISVATFFLLVPQLGLSTTSVPEWMPAAESAR